MKVLLEQISLKSNETKLREGFVKVQAEEEEDMYHLYNLIAKGDVVETSTIRNVVVVVVVVVVVIVIIIMIMTIIANYNIINCNINYYNNFSVITIIVIVQISNK